MQSLIRRSSWLTFCFLNKCWMYIGSANFFFPSCLSLLISDSSLSCLLKYSLQEFLWLSSFPNYLDLTLMYLVRLILCSQILFFYMLDKELLWKLLLYSAILSYSILQGWKLLSLVVWLLLWDLSIKISFFYLLIILWLSFPLVLDFLVSMWKLWSYVAWNARSSVFFLLWDTLVFFCIADIFY